MFAEDEGEQPARGDRDSHADEAVEQETRRREVFQEEDGGDAREEADECGTSADAREEDAHEEESAQAAGEQSHDFLEEVEQRENVPSRHEQRYAHADDAGDDARRASHPNHRVAVGLRTEATVEIHTESRGDRVDVGGNRAHRGSKDGGDEESRKSLRQL